MSRHQGAERNHCSARLSPALRAGAMTPRLTLGGAVALAEQAVGGRAIRVRGVTHRGAATLVIDIRSRHGTSALHVDLATQTITVERPVPVMHPVGRE
ncbi:hypothetical protein [Bosea vaviloviae]|uniref:hypothetical protein n=1 Tax=Bosea vaviloviae TaxID=1526658 RepID=UPI000ABF38EB|nr:hypothetical protein [Bosea vaviloviae]